MPNSNQDIERVEQAFRVARSELERVSSSRDEIARRVAAASMKRGPRRLIAGTIAALTTCAFCSVLWWRASTFPPPPGGSALDVPPGRPEELKIEIGGAELTEYIAGIIDDRIVVIWSYRGDNVTVTPAIATQCSAGKYRLTTMRQVKLADGRTVVCSLLTPDAEVRPILEPPLIYARPGEDQLIAMSVAPHVSSEAELADAIRFAGADGKAGMDMENILLEIRKTKEAGTPRKVPL